MRSRWPHPTVGEGSDDETEETVKGQQDRPGEDLSPRHRLTAAQQWWKRRRTQVFRQSDSPVLQPLPVPCPNLPVLDPSWNRASSSIANLVCRLERDTVAEPSTPQLYEVNRVIRSVLPPPVRRWLARPPEASPDLTADQAGPGEPMAVPRSPGHDYVEPEPASQFNPSVYEQFFDRGTTQPLEKQTLVDLARRLKASHEERGSRLASVADPSHLAQLQEWMGTS